MCRYRPFFALVLTVLAALFLPTHQAGAQETAPEKTILVLDASGSMWGQINGRTKIEIAQEVVGQLLKTLPDNQELGLTVYGHRRKGDCSDIETLVQPGTGTRDAIAKAVNAIRPKGKTPLSAAVVQAAEALKYEEDAATVILISDGRETCNLDPCEVGRALEQAGVNFTAHVIGFDVAKAADRAQLQCLAENTGGTFRTASNVDELRDALKQVATTPPPPAPGQVRFVAIEGDGGPRLSEGLLWTLTNLDSGAVLRDTEATATLNETLLPGRYKAEVLRADNETTAEATLRVFQNTDTTVTLILPLLIPAATLNAPDTVIAGSTFKVDWDGPAEDRDWISTATADQRDPEFVTYQYTSEGSPLSLRAPPVPGTYELRYVLDSRSRVIARVPLRVLPVEAAFDLPATAFQGETVTIDWDGPDYQGDYLSSAPIGSRDSKYLTYTYTSTGSPTGLVMPSEPGRYEIRYVMDLGNTVLLRKEIEVLPASASIAVPATATAGAQIPVTWSGPDYERDYIAVVPAGSDEHWINYTYTAQGSPATLLMPAEPGAYEIRYVMNQNNRVLASAPITLTDASATLDAPMQAFVGEPVSVIWTGPDYERDFLAVSEIDSRDSAYLSYTYTSSGSPAQVVMPLVPGTYELRYVQDQGNTVMVRRQIEVVPVDATLSVNGPAIAGGPLNVTWSGPNYERDYIAVSQPGSRDSAYINYSYTRNGSPIDVQLPPQPGEYELRYMANGSPDRALARLTITSTAPQASVSGPSSGAAGSEIEVTWTGPGFKRDYIAIGREGTPYATYSYTSHGSPLNVQLPDEPGQWEIRYMLGAGDAVIASQPITVE